MRSPRCRLRAAIMSCRSQWTSPGAYAGRSNWKREWRLTYEERELLLAWDQAEHARQRG